jgi:pilus assembly protein CpaE
MHRDPIQATTLVKLKVAILAPQRATLEHVRDLLEAWDSSLVLTLHPGGAPLAARIAEQEHPDVMLIEGERHDYTEFAVLEPLTARHPGTAVLLLSPNQSADFLRNAMRIGLRDVLPSPVSRDALHEAMGRVKQRASSVQEGRRRGKVLSFIGCKGGSGATFIATNVGYMLAELEHKKVAVIDLNFQFGDAALYVTHRTPSCTVADVADEVHRLDGALLASSMIQVLPNFHILPAPDEPEQALRVRPESIEPLLRVAAAEYDVVIIDAGRSLDDVTVRAMDQSDVVYAVLQLNLPFIRDAKRLMHALSALGYGKDKVKLLVNRFHKGGAITLEDLAETLRHEVFRTVPNSFDAVAASVNQGVPILKLSARDPVAKGLREMAGSLIEKKVESGGWLRRLSRA